MARVLADDSPAGRGTLSRGAADRGQRGEAAGAVAEWLSDGAERYLVRAKASSLDGVSAALNAETAEVAVGKAPRRHSHSYSHSRHRIRRLT
jgi:hypothetical protein